MTASALELNELSFSYRATPVLSDVSLRVEPGSLFALLGPSGSGKSTLLSIVAGLLEPHHGRVLLDGQEITSAPPERRDIGVVFQGYALFPHLTALENIAFGLRRRGVDRRSAHAQAEELADRLGLVDLSHRKPDELSGGQQQRVALARAVATRPRLLLLDEPLSNIDPALRAQVRVQLREWLTQWSITTILVTHDREDAFWLADHLGLLQDGRLVQTGPPMEVYRRPIDAQAAQLLGPVNRLPLASLEPPQQLVDISRARAFLLARPEETVFSPTAASSGASWPARVVQSVHLGAELRVLCELDHQIRIWAGRVETEPAPGSMGHVRIQEPRWVVGVS